MVRAAGATEVHMRISCPPTISPCFYGVDTPSKKDLIAANKTRRRDLRVHRGGLAGVSFAGRPDPLLHHGRAGERYVSRVILHGLLYGRLPDAVGGRGGHTAGGGGGELATSNERVVAWVEPSSRQAGNLDIVALRRALPAYAGAALVLGGDGAFFADRRKDASLSRGRGSGIRRNRVGPGFSHPRPPAHSRTYGRWAGMHILRGVLRRSSAVARARGFGDAGGKHADDHGPPDESHLLQGLSKLHPIKQAHCTWM